MGEGDFSIINGLVDNIITLGQFSRVSDFNRASEQSQ